MKVTHGIGLVAIGLAVGAGAWLGCGGDDSSGVAGNGQDASTDSAGGGDDSGGGSGDTGAGTVSCQTYCQQVHDHCVGDIPNVGDAAPTKQYNTTDGCLAECARMDLGTIADQGGQDTVGCRQYHSGAPAAGDPALHCAHAGPSGGGVCSGGAQGTDRCATFCKLQAKICQADSGTGVPASSQPYASEADCLASCGTPSLTLSPTNAELVQGGTGNNDNLNCRQYHLMAAYSDIAGGSTQLHCPHLAIPSRTAADGGGPCR